MFKQGTVFVVGAGASQEFGLPVGWDLMQQIKANSRFRFERIGRMQGDKVIYDAIQARVAGIQDEASRKQDSDGCFEALSEINRAIDSAGSIDEFINRNAHDPYIADMGKLQIAFSIATAERTSKDAASDAKGGLSADTLWQDTWISYFARGLFEGVRSRDLAAIGRGIIIICFNYDRCIEYYLTLAIQQSFQGVSFEQALQIVNNIDIIHPYGSLGRLPGSAGDGPEIVQFGPDVTPDYLSKSTADLVTWSESIRDAGMVDAMREAIREADTIVFLGFAFAKQNMDLLGIEDNFNSERMPEVYGTAYGFGIQVIPALKHKIMSLYSNLRPNEYTLNTVSLEKDMRCRDFMRTYLPLLVE